jgi:putative oxidoreductase
MSNPSANNPSIINTSTVNKIAQTFASVWMPIERGLEALKNPALLAARIYVGWVFFSSGLTKLRDWETTVALFTDEYKIPVLTNLSPTLAAILGTGGELILPVLLVAGLFGRFAALGLFVVNIVAVISLSEIAPAAMQQHQFWGSMLAGLAIWGVGAWAVETTGWFKEKNKALLGL